MYTFKRARAHTHTHMYTHLHKCDTQVQETGADDELPPRFEGELLKPRHMKIVQMVYGDSWPEIAELMRRAPGVTLRVVLRRLQRKDSEWRKTRRDMNRIWSAVYHRSAGLALSQHVL